MMFAQLDSNNICIAVTAEAVAGLPEIIATVDNLGQKWDFMVEEWKAKEEFTFDS